MIFESLWPLLFLAAVPVIIILYLLKPKGEDYLISSNLLWKELLKNEQSRTFLEKFVHNILMYLQILITVLLVIALMSPFIKVDGQRGGRKILLLDTSGSMQHVSDTGKSRMEEAVSYACDIVRNSENTKFSIVTTDAAGVKLLAVDLTDTDSLVETLQRLECSDGGGTLVQAQNVLDTLMGDTAQEAAALIVCTDGEGADGFEKLQSTGGKELFVAGTPSANIANEYTAYTRREDELYDVMVSVANYSDEEVSFEVSLYDENSADEKLVALKQLHLMPSESTFCLFEAVEWQGQVLSSRLDSISFSEGARDSLMRDNISQAVKGKKQQLHGLLVGEGNTFLEKAYLAVTGESIAKSASDDALMRTPLKEMEYNAVIYDTGTKPQPAASNRLVFGALGGSVTETLENVILEVTDCDLAAGLSGFTVGVNTAYCFDLPEGAQCFLEHDGRCAGYYREADGIREIVVGFDIRESDFPLRAEFPVFLANAMNYLTDTSWLSSTVCYAGEEILLQPWAELDRTQFDSRPSKAGVYSIGKENSQESYVVRFQTATESDGRREAASVSGTGGLGIQKVKRTLRTLFLIIVLALLVLEWVVYVRQMRYRGRFYLAVRGCLVFCIFLALSGVRLYKGSSQTATVFVVDYSNSNEAHIGEMEEYLAEAVSHMPAGNVYGIVTFGKNTLVEQFLTSEKHYAGLMTVPEKTATNFEEAVSKALMMIPAEYSKRLVVLTDGKETRGDIRNMAQALTASRAEFLTLLFSQEEKPDAYIDSVVLPSYLYPGDKYSITVLVESNFDTEAVLALYDGSRQTAANNVHLNKGRNRFVFSAQVNAEAGRNSMETLRVQVQAQGDTCAENDSYNAYSIVEMPPSVLVISGQETDTSGFASVLNAAGCNYSMVSALNAPNEINAMLEYKAMILVDTYIDELPDGFLANLETYVKDYGCGFVCCGGENSYALGGYRDTVLETVLPVEMQLRSFNEIPSMAMVMVIDRSGSMSSSVDGRRLSNLDMAVRAAEVAVDNLGDSDYVGILTFDDRYQWQTALRQADDKQTIKDQLWQIEEGGGTTIKPALREAYNVLSNNPASVRHVVLLTDGMGETKDYSDIISDYAGSGITLSTVAVGEGADQKTLEQLADMCGGRYYYSDSSSDIPRIFAQEVFLGSDSYIQNGVFSLAVQGGHELTANLFADGWPALYGYVAATPKTASNPVIVSGEKGDPLLTVWQYGLGRSVAWNSDVTGEWSGAFAGQEDYVQLWKRIVDYTTGNTNLGEDRVEVVTAGDQTEILYRTEDFDSGTEIMVTVINPSEEKTEERLRASAPGSYSAKISTPQAGLYHFTICRTKGGEIQNYMTTAAAVQFSDEYKFDVSAASYLKFAEQYGRLLTGKEKLWTRIAAGERAGYPLTNWLLAFALVLFLADVAMRRLQYVPKSLPFLAAVRRRKAQKLAESTAYEEKNGAAAESAALADTAQEPPVQNTASKAGQKKKQQKKRRQSEETLDTSQLLKKREERRRRD